MENILKSAIREEVARLQDNNEQSSGNKAPKKKHLEKRMGNLLSKIRGGIPSTTATSKMRKVNIKWKRISPQLGEHTVSARKGGGHRFVNMSTGETLEVLMKKSIDLFFSKEGNNSFGEHFSVCNFSLTDQTGDTLQLSQTLNDYLTLKNVYLSKMYFVLTSSLNEQYCAEYINPTVTFSTNLFDSQPQMLDNSPLVQNDFVLQDQSCDATQNSNFDVPKETNAPILCQDTLQDPHLLQHLSSQSYEPQDPHDQQDTLIVQHPNVLEAQQDPDAPPESIPPQEPQEPIAHTNDPVEEIVIIDESKKFVIHRLNMRRDIIQIFKTVDLGKSSFCFILFLFPVEYHFKK